VFKELLDEGVISNQPTDQESREPIPQDVMDKVWNRDGGRCVKCGSQENLEFDHIAALEKLGKHLGIFVENNKQKYPVVIKVRDLKDLS
jgi:5-methylcytosine-specific restriction endonuclease McrA